MSYQIALRDPITGEFIPSHAELPHTLQHAYTWAIDQEDAEAILGALRIMHRTGQEWEITIINR